MTRDLGNYTDLPSTAKEAATASSPISLLKSIKNQLSKGAVATPLNLIEVTTTSAAIDCRGYNSILVYQKVTVATKLWTTKIQGALESGDTYADWYEGATLMSSQTNSTKASVWRGIPDYIKLVGTEDEDGGKLTVKIQLMNLY